MSNLSRIQLKVATEFRARARDIGLTPYLSRVRAFAKKWTGEEGYEARFDRALFAAIRPGDIVWDVGANVGIYTTRFADACAPGGRVVAFEPVPDSHAELVEVTRKVASVETHAMALGSTEATASMNLSTDPMGVSNSLVEEYAQGGGTIDVRVSTGDALVGEGTVPSPNVIKIDVEGFEEEVLKGLRATIERPDCRSLFIEVHFKVLDSMGQRQAPSRIQDMLETAGYRTFWIDASHIGANRLS